jgi:3-dehydroquinate synthase
VSLGAAPGGRGVRIRVHTPGPPAVDCDVLVGHGMLGELPRLVAANVPADAFAIISPEPVAALYGEALLAAMRQSGVPAELLRFPDGEEHKTRDTWAALTDRLLELGFGRRTCVIAVGGGVTGDLAGFVAATYMRGVPIVQVPTTLLAMIDASVGGKTAVDTPAGKNLVGAFHTPRLVVMDPAVLATLPDAALREGLAEAVKHGVILDAAYFGWLAEHAASLLARSGQHLEHLVARSVELKAGVVAGDPHDQGFRTVLNFGHTVAHALERQMDFGLAHGVAVAIGMVAEALAGEELGITTVGTAAAIGRVLIRCGLPIRPPVVDAAELIATMRLDKKSHRAAVRCALPRAIGEAAPAPAGGWAHDVPDDVLHNALKRAAEGLPVV